ncbi:hypothetical protein BHE74_00002247 [Ensete ventricosum]|nr:hypothetical protein BHE74_00002247 [Ensete ventricosum]
MSERAFLKKCNPATQVVGIRRAYFLPLLIQESTVCLCIGKSEFRVRVLPRVVGSPVMRTGLVGLRFRVQVAQRRFQSGNGMFSFGWIYIGSHNFSPAAWGNTLLSSSESKAPKLHICNYELGIVLIVPPPDLSVTDGRNRFNLDDFVLPFVMPAPEYQDGDRPATAQAMREACVEVTSSKESVSEDATEELNEEDIVDEEVTFEESDFCIQQESEEERIYAEMLWGQVDSC